MRSRKFAVLVIGFTFLLLPGANGGNARPLVFWDSGAAAEWDAQERAARLSASEGKYFVWAEKGERIVMRMAISPKNHSAHAVIAVKWSVSPYARPEEIFGNGEAKLTLADSNFSVVRPLDAAEGQASSKEEMLENLRHRIEFVAPEADLYLVRLQTKGTVLTLIEEEFQTRPCGVVAALPGDDRSVPRPLPSWPNVPTYFYIPKGVEKFTVVLAEARNPSFALKISDSSGNVLLDSPQESVGEVAVKNPTSDKGSVFSLKTSSVLKIAIPEAAPFFARHPRNLAAIEPDQDKSPRE